MTKIDRRAFLRGAGAVGGGYALLGPAAGAEAIAARVAGPFQHGVASGDPLSDRVMLWIA